MDEKLAITGLRTLRMHNSLPRGFTLIELMVVVVIIGILAAIAYPNYTRFIIESRRTDAQIALTQLAALEEKFFSQCNRYTDAIDSGAISPNCTGLGLPSSGTSGSIYSTDRFYTLSVTLGTASGPATSYVATATPVAGKSQANDGKFAISNTGLKQWDKNNNGTFDAGEDTWKKN